MIKLFTQDSFISENSDDRLESYICDSEAESANFNPSEETISFLKSFARSFVVDLSKDVTYSVPMA